MVEVKNAPEIRFDGFDEPWEIKNIGELSDHLQYGLNAAATKYDGENKYLRITDIDDESRSFMFSDITSPNIDYSVADQYLLKEGDILFARTGASVGKTYRYRKVDKKVYFAGFLIRARIKEDYNSEFVFQNTLTEKYEMFVRLTSQRSGQPGVNAQEYGEFELMIPNKPEQTAIGNFFRNLDDTIALKKQQYEQTANIKKAMLEKMFPKKGADVPEVRFEGFAGAWEVRKIYEIADVVTGSTPPTAFKEYYNGDFLFVSPADIQGNRYISSTATTLTKEGFSLGRKVRSGAALFVSIGSTIGKVAQATTPLVTNQQINSVIGNSEVDDDFIFTVLESVSHSIRQSAATQAVPIVNKTNFSGVCIWLPKLVEQKQIGNFFRNLDALITAQQEEVEMLQNIKKAFLVKMFI